MTRDERVRFFFGVIDNAIDEDSPLSSDEVELIAEHLADHPLISVEAVP